MDLRLLAMIANARVQLRYTIDQQYPHLINEAINMAKYDIARPMELAALKGRLQRARTTETAIAFTGQRYDAVLDEIDELHGAARSHVGHLEMYKGDLQSTIERMVGGSNGGPNDGPDGQIGQVITSKTTPAASGAAEAVTVTAAEVGEVPAAVVTETVTEAARSVTGVIAPVTAVEGQA